MKWNDLKSLSQFDELVEQSYEKPQLVFKHSTSCPISAIVKSRFEGDWKKQTLISQEQCFILDLLANRAVSNEVAGRLSVRHESPQLLLIDQGKALYNASHTSISVQDLADFLAK